jgi:hypothetical protein
MQLTQAQVDLLVADIAVNRASINAGDTAGAAAFYNALAVPDFLVWNPSTPTKDLMDAITWANMTPTDIVPDATATAPVAATWLGRAIACQGKQFNIQTILVGRDFIDATKANVRAGLQDALSNLPSGLAGAAVSGGWASVKIALTRKATRLEKLLATGTGTALTPAVMGFVGAAQPNQFNGIV